MAYQHVSIVFHLCTLCPKYTDPNEQWVLNHLHKEFVDKNNIDDDEMAIVLYGLKRWREAGKPRATIDPVERKGDAGRWIK